MYKIYESNNYIIVEDVNRKETFYGHKKEVFIDKSNLNNPAYRIFKVRDLKEGTLIEIGKIQKEDDSLYTEEEFDTFYRTNTGNFNGGGTAPTGDFIPLAGTETDKPVTGNIITSGQVAIGGINGSGYVSTNFDSDNVFITLNRQDPTTDFFTALGLESDSNIYITGTNPEFRGLTGGEDYSERITELDYTQKIYVDSPSTQTQTQRSTQTSGTDTMNFDGRNGIYIHEADLTPSLILNLPPTPVDSQIVTIMSVGGIATLTLATAVGTIIGAVTALTALVSVKFIWLASENKWYRI